MEKQNGKIKVLRIINRFNIGGPTYNATFLTRYLDKRFETKLLGGVPDEGEKDSHHILEKYEVKPIIIEELQRNPKFFSDRKAYKKIKRIIKEYKPDIVHTHAAKAGALGRKAAYSCKVPIILHTFHGHVFHSYFGKFKTSIFKFIERRLASKSTRIIAISNKQKDELSKEHKICKANKIEIIPLGFDLLQFQEKRKFFREEIRAKYKLDKDTVAVAIIGRLAPVKDHAFFLKIVKDILSKTTAKVKFFIVGDGSEKEWIEKEVFILNEQFNNKIEMTSWIKDIAKFNAGMDIICLTSKNEGTPVSLIEAQAGNIPVISTNVGGVSDIVLDNETGFIIDRDDFETYSDKLRLLVEDDNLREKFSVNGYEFVKEKFHYTTLVKNMENLYLNLYKEK